VDTSLTSDDLTVYRVLSSGADVPALKAMTGSIDPMAPDTVTRSVERLSRLGLLDDPSHAVPPDRALSMHLHDASEAAHRLLTATADLEQATGALQVLNDKLPELLAPHEETSLQLVTGVDDVAERIVGICTGARTRVLTMNLEDGTPDAVLDAAAAALLRVARDGVAVRCLYLHTAPSGPESPLARLQGGGAVVRTRSHLPFRLLLVDDQVAICPAEPGQSSTGAVVLRGAVPLRLLVAVFETFWVESRPLSGGRPDPRRGPQSLQDPETKQLVRWLAEGLGDSAIARRLGVTERTVSRRLTAVFQLLGAESRFQAGVRASEVGLA